MLEFYANKPPRINLMSCQLDRNDPYVWLSGVDSSFKTKTHDNSQHKVQKSGFVGGNGHEKN